MRYLSLFSDFARAKRAGWSGIVYLSESDDDMARIVLEEMEVGDTLVMNGADEDVGVANALTLDEKAKRIAAMDFLSNIV